MKRKLLTLMLALFAVFAMKAQDFGLAIQSKSKANDIDVFSKGMEKMNSIKGTLFTDDFSTLTGWTLEGTWGIGEATVEPVGDHTQNGDNIIMGGPLNADYINSNPQYFSTSPVIDCSAQAAVTFSFWSFSGCENNSWDHMGIEVWDGAAWVSIYANGSTSFQENVWTYWEFDVTAYAAGNANFQIRFYFGPTDTSVTYSGWGIDDVMVTYPEPHDLGVDVITPTFVSLGETVTPQVTVHNYGSSEETTWSVQLTDGAGYDETVSNPGTISVASNYVVDFPDWTPSEGTYTLTAIVTVADDANADNDEMSVECNVIDAQISYTVNSTTGQFASIILPMGAETPIGAFSVANFPMAMEYAADGNYYVIRNAPAVLSTVDISTGAETVIGTMSGMTGTPTGLAYDWDNDIMYICVLNGSSLPQLGTIDLTTAAATLIGTGATGMLIAMDFDNDGNLFAPSLSPDELFQIDLTTGATTSIGAIGFDLNYGQDVSFDKTAGVMYGTLYDNSGAGGVLCTIDLTTGAATQLYPYADQHACFAIPYQAAVSYNVTFNVNMADSIASGYFVEGTDQLWVGGSMNSWTMPGDDAMYEMAESATNDIYTLTMTLADGDYMYKYFKIVGGVSSWDNGEWNGDPNREFSMAGADVELNDVFGVQPIGINTITNSISVYPNPSNGVFNIKVESLTKLEVFDITGKMIHTQSVNGLTSIQLNNAGVYFLRFSNNEGTAVQRVVVK